MRPDRHPPALIFDELRRLVAARHVLLVDHPDVPGVPLLLDDRRLQRVPVRGHDHVVEVPEPDRPCDADLFDPAEVLGLALVELLAVGEPGFRLGRHDDARQRAVHPVLP